LDLIPSRENLKRALGPLIKMAEDDQGWPRAIDSGMKKRPAQGFARHRRPVSGHGRAVKIRLACLEDVEIVVQPEPT
jgi:hypothetical protein